MVSLWQQYELDLGTTQYRFNRTPKKNSNTFRIARAQKSDKLSFRVVRVIYLDGFAKESLREVGVNFSCGN